MSVINSVLPTAHVGDTLSLASMEIVARGWLEYDLMFNLQTDGVLERLLAMDKARILDCPGSTSSFGKDIREIARQRRSSLDVVSTDIVYEEPATRLLRAATDTLQRLLQPHLVRGNWDGQKWISPEVPFKTPVELLRHRENTYDRWFHDSVVNEGTSAYVASALPTLSELEGCQFEQIMCGNLLFAYAEKAILGATADAVYEFHRASLNRLVDLLKPDGELRVFPIGTGSKPEYERLPALIDDLRARGCEVTVKASDYKFVVHWDRVLVVRKPK